jgi:hypothetical protein
VKKGSSARQRLETFAGSKLLLMGSKAYRVKKLPHALEKKIDEAIERKMKIVVGEVPGACRLFQDYLRSRDYRDIVVGHAKSIRYNAGLWKTKQYGKSVSEREKSMIEECDSAIIIWQDTSGVIAENLELLKRQRKPTFLYEYSTKTGRAKTGWLDPERVYDPYYSWKEYMRKGVRRKKRCGGGI